MLCQRAQLSLAPHERFLCSCAFVNLSSFGRTRPLWSEIWSLSHYRLMVSNIISPSAQVEVRVDVEDLIRGVVNQSNHALLTFVSLDERGKVRKVCTRRLPHRPSLQLPSVFLRCVPFACPWPIQQ